MNTYNKHIHMCTFVKKVLEFENNFVQEKKMVMPSTMYAPTQKLQDLAGILAKFSSVSLILLKNAET